MTKLKSKHIVFIAMLLVSFALQAKSQIPTTVIDVKLLPEGSLLIKNRYELAVRFLSDGFAFSGAPIFPEVQIDGAIVVPPQSGMNITERRNGQTWIGVERRYSVYPTRTGQLVVPAVTIEASVRTSAGVTDVTAQSESFVREVSIQPELVNYPDSVITSNLELSQLYEPDVNELLVGDALKRTITIRATNTISMLLPILDSTKPNDISIYRDRPVLQDRDQRGSILATRTDSVTYMMEKEGQYQLPDITIYWWNPESLELKESLVPGLEFTVSPNPALVAEQVGMLDGENISEDIGKPGNTTAIILTIIFTVTFIYCVLWYLNRRYGTRLQAAFSLWQQRRQDSEKVYFKRFQQACLTDDPREILRTLLAWLDRQSEFQKVMTLEEFTEQVSNVELTRLINDLYARLFGKNVNVPGSWSGEPLAKAVAQARRKGQKQLSKTQGDIGLCPLNPSA